MKPSNPSAEQDYHKVSAEITELIDRKPTRLIKWAPLILCLIFIGALAITWSVEYPTVMIYKGTLKVTDKLTSVTLITPMSGFSHVEVKQKVNVKFENYPWEDFGSVSGIVLSLKNNAGATTCQITFPDGLTTSSGKIISPKDGLLVEVHIRNGKQKLIKLIFDRL